MTNEISKSVLNDFKDKSQEIARQSELIKANIPSIGSRKSRIDKVIFLAESIENHCNSLLKIINKS